MNDSQEKWCDMNALHFAYEEHLNSIYTKALHKCSFIKIDKKLLYK